MHEDHSIFKQRKLETNRLKTIPWGAKFYRLVTLITICLFLLGNSAHSASANRNSQAISPAEKAARLLETLTPEERVGQLFLVTFDGTDVGTDSHIYDLITNRFVGGIILLASKDNFGPGVVPRQTWGMNRQLQLSRWASSQENKTNPITQETFKPSFIPLFIGTIQEGDGYPYDQILSGLTPLPNQMAEGATWNPDLASQVGAVLGKELSSIGINLILGPSLDVLENPHPEGSNDLGTRTFGGDPYWVGLMGSAYISGVHEGSNGKVGVIAKHFPGHGSSDRLPEEEVATVRKSLEELKNFDLSPFFDVTGNASSPEATTDGLLVSHIRYQGFQSNIRATTRPVSFDPQAFNLLMSLPQLDKWRKAGGVMVSDNLGSRAVRRFYELTNQTFDMPRRVALNAFLAGNDILYVDDFSSGESDSYSSAVRTLEFFAQKYREDKAFAKRVDESVLRILTLKYRLYPDFALGVVLPPPTGYEQVGDSSEVTFEVARQSATLISPAQTELDETVPDAPNLNDRIVFITDMQTEQQCSTCRPQPVMRVNDLQDVVLQRYGPQAGGQVSPVNLSSYSLDDLEVMLKGGEENSEIERDLKRANWIVFSMLQPTAEYPSYAVLSQFLSERPDLFQQKRLYVFGFNAPYFLDATNVSKLTAYYGLYSKLPQFIDVAAYLLFRELRPTGSLPVSVTAVGYDLNTALFPNPDQTIPLELDLPSPEPTGETATPEPLPTPEFKVGDVISVRTGVILDHNGHPVPNGVPVDFSLTVGGQLQSLTQTASTTDGIARTTFQITGPGTYEIRAESEPAKQSDILRFDISSPNGNLVTPTATELPSPTPTQTTTPTSTPVPVQVISTPSPDHLQLQDWIMAFLITIAIGWTSYRLSALMGQIRWGVRGGFLVIIGGLAAYTYLLLNLPGSVELLQSSISRGVLVATVIGSFLGLLINWIWRLITRVG